MVEQRRDPLTGKTVIVSSRQPGKPHGYIQVDEAGSGCAFCGIAERRDVAERRVAGPARAATAVTPRWPLITAGPAASGESPITHDLIIWTDRHVECISELDAAELGAALELTGLRIAKSQRDGAHPVAFVNAGASSGASQPHLHGQVIGLDQPGPGERTELAATSDSATCAICCHDTAADLEVLRRSSGTDVVRSWCPSAPAGAYELRFAPETHTPDFSAWVADAARRQSLALVLLHSVRALRACAGDVGYNMVIHGGYLGSGHWHIHLITRLGQPAGFEFASGWWVTNVTASSAAERLRDAVTASGVPLDESAPEAGGVQGEGVS